MDIIKTLEDEQLRENKFNFHVGDTVKVDYLIKEGNKERVQVYEGTVIKMQGTGLRRTFTVRRLAYGVGVERTFLINSPRVTNVRLVREGKVRRSKLFYLRDREGKAAKVKEKQKF